MSTRQTEFTKHLIYTTLAAVADTGDAIELPFKERLGQFFVEVVNGTGTVTALIEGKPGDATNWEPLVASAAYANPSTTTGSIEVSEQIRVRITAVSASLADFHVWVYV